MSQLSRMLVSSYINETEEEAEEELQECYDMQDAYESDAEYGVFEEEHMSVEQAKLYMQFGYYYTPENVHPARWKAIVSLIGRRVV